MKSEIFINIQLSIPKGKVLCKVIVINNLKQVLTPARLGKSLRHRVSEMFVCDFFLRRSSRVSLVFNGN